MARNRFLFDLIGVVVGFGLTGLMVYFSSGQADQTAIIFSVVGLLGGALLLGFFCYKNDGIKIAAIMIGLIVLGSIIVGVLMIVGAGGFIEAFAQDIITAIIGPILGIIIIILGIIMIVGSIVIGGIFIGFTAIGSAIGEAVWKDKKDSPKKNYVSEPGTTYVPSQDAYQPVAPAKPQGPVAAVCKQCNASNPGGDKFCINCGAKM